MIQVILNKPLILSVALFFSVILNNHATDLTIDQMLEKAEQIKSSNPSDLLFELNKIETYSNQLTAFQLAQLNYLKAYERTFAGDINTAIEMAKAISIADTPVTFKIKLALFIANSAAVKEDWSLALEKLNEGIELAEIEGSDEILATGYITAALTLNLLHQHKSAFEFASKLKGLKLQGRTLCVSKQIYIESGLYTDRIQPHSFEVNDAITTCEAINENLWAHITRLYHAKALNKNKQYIDAITSLIVHIKSIEDTKYPRIIAAVYAELALSYFKTANLNKAKSYALKAVNTPQSLEFSEPTAIANEVLYKIAKQEENYQQALEHYEKFSLAEQAHLDEVSAKEIAFQLAQNQSLQQKSKIELLNKENELLNSRNDLLKTEQTLAQSEAENTRLIATLLSAIVVLLAFFGYRSWHSQRRLKVLAEYDHLTKINNRGHFMALAEETMSLAERAHQTASCIILDLDKFKSINDTYGHAAGDWALKAVVEAVKPCIRDHDIFARLGGEEFVILLPSCDIQAATFVTEKCLKVIEAIDTADSGNQFKITASFGITTTRTSGYQVTSLINDADKALYQSKENGRNQMTIFTNEDD